MRGQWQTASDRSYVFDHESQFREEVVERFADDYLAGDAVPCIRAIWAEVPDLLRMAQELGADCLATGHYVRRVESASGPELHRSLDPARDQSYFLFATNDRQLAFLRFPLGGLPKQVVRGIAADFGLAVATKADSQDICFVPNGDYANIVRLLRPEGTRRGAIVHAGTGETLGQHAGVIHYGWPATWVDIGGHANALRRSLERACVIAGRPKLLLAVGAGISANQSHRPVPDIALTARCLGIAAGADRLDGSLARINGGDRFADPESELRPAEAR